MAEIEEFVAAEEISIEERASFLNLLRGGPTSGEALASLYGDSVTSFGAGNFEP